jgi:hypothetical protein
MSKRHHEDDGEDGDVEQARSMFKYATLEETKHENDTLASTAKRKGDHENTHGERRTTSPPMTLWNKLRWTVPRVWEEITSREQIPHPMLLRFYINTHYNVKSSNTVEHNLSLLMSLLNVH